MMVRWLAVVMMALLAACTPEAQDTLARETAKTVVNPIIAARFPGVPVQPISDCVIDNATAPEIIVLADAALNGITPEARQLTLTILNRPETIECISTKGISGVLAGLRI